MLNLVPILETVPLLSTAGSNNWWWGVFFEFRSRPPRFLCVVCGFVDESRHLKVSSQAAANGLSWFWLHWGLMKLKSIHVKKAFATAQLFRQFSKCGHLCDQTCSPRTNFLQACLIVPVQSDNGQRTTKCAAEKFNEFLS